MFTNRHVAGPVCPLFWGTVTFDNHQEVACRSIFTDPIHDYAILEFATEETKHMRLTAIPLRPDLAKVGEVVRIIGNDAGQKLSVHTGVISRIDMDAPDYGNAAGGYSDFNTLYIQAPLGAVGGSSGSPLVDIDGNALGLQAGGLSKSLTDYILPLDRPLRTLKCLQQGKHVTRGTIQCQWRLRPYQKCKSLGLTTEWENRYRKAFPQGVGMLVAERVLPEGPSDSKIQVGDIMLQFSGELLAQFNRLDGILDSSVDKNLEIVLRRGDQDTKVEVKVGDLYHITPSRFVSVGGAFFNNLSYQLAQRYGVACKGVCVSSPGRGHFRGLKKQSILETVDGKKVPDLDTFIKVMKEILDQKRFVVTYRRLTDPYTLDRQTLINDQRWSVMKQWTQNNETGRWDVRSYAPSSKFSPAYLPVSFPSLQNAPDPIARKVRSFVMVSCTVPIHLNGLHRQPPRQPGIVLDAERGLVYVSQVAVPFDPCRIWVTIADSVTVPGSFVYQHREHGYTIIEYDTSLVGGPVEGIDMSPDLILNNARVHFIGMDESGVISSAATTVIDISAPPGLRVNSNRPNYRAINIELAQMETDTRYECPSGLVINEEGKVQAIWSNYFGVDEDGDDEIRAGALPTAILLPVISKLRMGERPNLRTLAVEFRPITVNDARDLNVSETWIRRMIDNNATHHQLLEVKRRIFVGADESEALLEGDVILRSGDNAITRFHELEDSSFKKALEARIVRNHEERTMTLHTIPEETFDTKQAVEFCGAVLQRPHFAVRMQGRVHSEVYVSAIYSGSPAHRSKLCNAQFITHLNNFAIHDLDSFLRTVKTIPDDSCKSNLKSDLLILT